MASAPDWNIEGAGWPNRTASRFVDAAGFAWHVQIMGQGPVLLLLHGTGAATHSWRDLAPLLARSFTVVAPDLPGHGFTALPPRAQLSLPGMAAALRELMRALHLEPEGLVGHSAGAAIALRMVLDGMAAPRAVVSLNGALMPFPGVAAVAFPALAKLLFLNPFAAPFLARRAAAEGAVGRLIAGTGSNLDAAGLSLYERLFRTERHMAATVGMMANWDLRGLKRDLPRLGVKLLLAAGDRDKAVSAKVAADAAALTKQAEIVVLPGLGHLAHEEAPAAVAGIIADALAADAAATPARRRTGRKQSMPSC